ncbi:hypothetical protein L228DRAFT_19027 [Xylona heveae TC161]|uniref:Uncharacterized protein n=1 Tax=Xylona heveae (strain CBS 132557 / TC161) TaxID=1328760 RepID=A0A165JYZ9_XYLHT|nr:hypothetical protein L228DRAFT_19027 [Xylona heveae TC161]KZF26806.1 hypothetical protein L228DRAFT_19027 [Xylona heveae TC161]
MSQPRLLFKVSQNIELLNLRRSRGREQVDSFSFASGPSNEIPNQDMSLKKGCIDLSGHSESTASIPASKENSSPKAGPQGIENSNAARYPVWRSTRTASQKANSEIARILAPKAKILKKSESQTVASKQRTTKRGARQDRARNVPKRLMSLESKSPFKAPTFPRPTARVLKKLCTPRNVLGPPSRPSSAPQTPRHSVGNRKTNIKTSLTERKKVSETLLNVLRSMM